MYYVTDVASPYALRAKGKGKSGGVRVIYYWAKVPEHIYLLTLYGKSERSYIDAATLKRIAKQLESMK